MLELGTGGEGWMIGLEVRAGVEDWSRGLEERIKEKNRGKELRRGL